MHLRQGLLVEPVLQYKNHLYEPLMSETKSAKQATLDLVGRLDEDVTYEDIMYELHVLQKIERGLRDADEGRVTSHKKAKERLSQWLK